MTASPVGVGVTVPEAPVFTPPETGVGSEVSVSTGVAVSSTVSTDATALTPVNVGVTVNVIVAVPDTTTEGKTVAELPLGLPVCIKFVN